MLWAILRMYQFYFDLAYGYISISYPAPFGPQLSSEPVSSQHANSNPPLHFLTPTVC